MRDRLSVWSYRLVVVGLGGLVIAVMVAPVVIGLLMSFTSGQTLRFPPPGYSLRWYGALLDPEQSGPLHVAAFNSIEIALYAVAGSLLFAVPASVGVTRLRAARAALVEPVLLAPLVLPSLVYGLAALMGAALIGLAPSKALVIAGHVVVFGPLMYRATVGVAAGIDPALEEVSATLGTGRLATFRRVTLPLLVPGILAGAFLVFMHSLDNVSITLFLADARTTVLPLRMFQMIEESLDVRVAAISGLLIAATLAVLILVQRAAPLVRPSGR